VSVELCSPSFWKIWVVCVSTVRSAMYKVSAMLV
jgi:hypothetical protein